MDAKGVNPVSAIPAAAPNISASAMPIWIATLVTRETYGPAERAAAEPRDASQRVSA